MFVNDTSLAVVLDWERGSQSEKSEDTHGADGCGDCADPHKSCITHARQMKKKARCPV